MTDAIIICTQAVIGRAATLLDGMGSPDLGIFSAARWHDAAGRVFACATAQLSAPTFESLRAATTEEDSPLRLIEVEEGPPDFDWTANDGITVLTGIRGDVALALMGLRQPDIVAIM